MAQRNQWLRSSPMMLPYVPKEPKASAEDSNECSSEEPDRREAALHQWFSSCLEGEGLPTSQVCAQLFISCQGKQSFEPFLGRKIFKGIQNKGCCPFE
jgi:hypothetical protein